MRKAHTTETTHKNQQLLRNIRQHNTNLCTRTMKGTMMKWTVTLPMKRIIFEDLNDILCRCSTISPVFPSFSDLCPRAKALLHLCCAQSYSSGDVGAHYDFESRGSSEECSCSATFRIQFPTRLSFVTYVQRCRKNYVKASGWRRAIITTSRGKNDTAVYRSIVNLVRGEVMRAGGLASILPYRPSLASSERVFSSVLDSNSLREYYAECEPGATLIAFDLFADGTTLSSSGSQSACPIRGMAIAELDLKEPCSSNAFYLFYYKQERAFLALKSVGSFMDCSYCMMPTRTLQSNYSDTATKLPDELNTVSCSAIQEIQTIVTNGVDRSVTNTVSRQIVVARAALCTNDDALTYAYNISPQATRVAKNYLHKVSAVPFPPALAAFCGMGSAPFHLYKSIGFDKLHTVDLGAERDISDNGYAAFSKPQYNKGVITKSALVRLANKRFRELPRVCRINISPFRNSSTDVHSNMTG
eukprot:IDg8884t1